MSISSSLANALSGLTAFSRSAEVVSSNISNALTEGYARREIDLQPRWVGNMGAGVRVAGVTRNANAFIIGERILADADLSHAKELLSYHQQVQNTFGPPDDPTSMPGRVTVFENALTEAASRPDSTGRLAGVLSAAQDLVDHLKQSSNAVQDLRMKADRDIANDVARLNAGLEQVRALNIQLRSNISAGQDGNSIRDLRQQVIDDISSIVPLRIALRDGDQVALYTTGGSILLDGQAATISFNQTGTITPDMTLASGALSGLMINGRAVTTGSSGQMGGGSLGAHFEIRDELATGTQSELDAVARDLLERFANPTLDTTLGVGDPGLFTDQGSAFVPTDEIGLSERLELNALADPAQGGELWRIREGLGAAVSTRVGDASLLHAFADALNRSQPILSGGFAGMARSASGLFSDVMSSENARLTLAHSDLSFALSQRDSLKSIELQDGVDSDAELQKLMQIEQAYAANARVVNVADSMLQILMELG